MPYQTFSFVAGCVGLCALILSLPATSWCEFVQLSLSTGQEINFGFWAYNSFTIVVDTSSKTAWKIETCNAYPSDIDMDGPWEASRAFSILAPMCGTIAIIVALCSSHNKKYLAKIAVALFLCTALFQGLTLLFLQSYVCGPDTNPIFEKFPNLPNTLDNCQLGSMAIVGIVATVAWFIAALVSVKAALAIIDLDENDEHHALDDNHNTKDGQCARN